MKFTPKRITRLVPDEHGLQVTLLNYLLQAHQKDLYCFAIPNAGKRGFQTAARMRAEGLRAGVADLCVMMQKGRVCWLELKSEKGRSSSAQNSFGEICKVLGHSYAVVHNFDEALDALRIFGAIE